MEQLGNISILVLLLLVVAAGIALGVPASLGVLWAAGIRSPPCSEAIMSSPDRVLGVTIMVTSLAAVAASFCWTAAIFFVAGILTAIVAVLIINAEMEEGGA